VIFVCSCSEDVNAIMLKEFVYRIIMNNYPSHWNREKILRDKENWLVEGIANYIAAKTSGGNNVIKNQVNTFLIRETPLEWFNSGTLEQYGATYTFFDFLEQKYGPKIIDKTLVYLRSGMVSNNKCANIEQCVLLQSIYEVNGWDMDDKRRDLSFSKILQEWASYVAEQQDDSGLNAFQKAEAVKALAKHDADLPLTATEMAVLDFVKIQD